MKYRALLPLPQWEGGEHTYLGDHVTLHLDGKAWPAWMQALSLANTLALTYGQILALGGDFYGLPDEPICQDPNPPERFLKAYHSLAQAKAAKQEVPRILDVMQLEINAVNRAVREGRQPSAAYAALGDSLSAQWNVITGGGSAISDLVPPGRYLQLAATNWDHFGKHAIECYTVGHLVAMQEALVARYLPDPSDKRLHLMNAYAMNAFADHYLTDIFSSGHMRTPRKALYDRVTPSTVGSLLARFMHDEDSAYGLQVVNARGETWTAYGDKRLLDTVNQENLTKVLTAVQISADEVWATYETGVLGNNQALNLVADLERVANPQNRHNPSPLFVRSGDTVERRNDLSDRFDYSWTKSWIGAVTLNELAHLPEFEDMGDGNIPVTLDAGVLQLFSHHDEHGHHKLGINQYGLDGKSFGLRWSRKDMGQHARALTFLSTDFRGNGQTQVLQLQDNHGKLGMILYAPAASGPGYQTAWSSEDVGQGSQAVQWLLVDRNGDGQKQVLQCWDNQGSLGMVLYGPAASGPGMETVWSADAVGSDSHAVKWLAVDRTGNGRTEIVQLTDNHGTLTMTVFAPDPQGLGYVRTWTHDLGQTSSAVAWLPLDYMGDGKIAVMQCWDNDGGLAMNLYTPDPRGPGYGLKWSSSNLGTGANAVAWFPIKLGGIDRGHVLQLWNNGRRLAMVLYAPMKYGPGYEVRWSTNDIGEGSRAVAWLAAADGPDDATSVIQLWRHEHIVERLAMVVYAPSPVYDGYRVAGSDDDLGRGPGGLAFFTASVPAP